MEMLIEILLGIVDIVIIVGLVLVVYKVKQLKQEKEQLTKETTALKAKVSMIEYHYRNYIEGKNPYTVMRGIGDVLQEYNSLDRNKGYSNEE